MTPIRLRLAGWVLTLYARREVHRSCDDLEWPDWFPASERAPLVRQMECRNGSDPIDVAESITRYADGAMCPPAWWLAEFFAEEMGYEE